MDGRALVAALTLLVTAAFSACADFESPADLVPDSIWEANLSPSVGGPTPDGPILTGQAGAVVQSGTTQAGILLNGIQGPLHWGLFQGSCAQPGGIVGRQDSYPVLSPDEPSAETELATPLNPTESYHVRAGPNADGSAPLACGELVRR